MTVMHSTAEYCDSINYHDSLVLTMNMIVRRLPDHSNTYLVSLTDINLTKLNVIGNWDHRQ